MLILKNQHYLIPMRHGAVKVYSGGIPRELLSLGTTLRGSATSRQIDDKIACR
jgi:hypothetical protein